MFINLIVALMPVLVKFLGIYVESSSSKKDDLVLDVVKKGAEYLAQKDNNSVSTEMAKSLEECEVKDD